LLATQFKRGPVLVNTGLLGRDLRIGRPGIHFDLFLFHLVLCRQFLSCYLRFFQDDIRNQTVLGEFPVRFEVQLRAVVVGLDAGLRCLLVQDLALQRRLKIRQVSLGSFELKFGVDSPLLDVGVAHHENDAVWCDGFACPQLTLLDNAVGSGWYEPNFFGNQRSESPTCRSISLVSPYPATASPHPHWVPPAPFATAPE